MLHRRNFVIVFMSDKTTINAPFTPYVRATYRWYVLALLTLVYTFNFVDRQILVILQEQIRVELDLMDWQLGMLSGFAFAVFYSVLGLPIAHFSESFGRKRVVALAIAFWSMMTAISGAAQNFTHLLLMRIGVGVGEAGGSPPSHSMISDIFPRRHRAFALSIFSMGVYFGYLVAYSLGGWVAEDLGWRTAFVVVGLPGVVIAVIVAATIKEPPRGLADHGYSVEAANAAVKEQGSAPGFSATIRFLWAKRSFRHIAFAASLHSLVGFGVGNFVPSYIIRAHDMAIGDIGWRLALIFGVGGAFGVAFSGWLTDRLAARGQQWYLWVPAIALIMTLPLVLFTFLADTPSAMLLAYAPYSILGAMWLGPSLAITHSLVGLRQRAVASATLFFLINLIGLGLGPLTIGMLSDLMRPAFGDAGGLRHAIIGVALLGKTWCVIHFLVAARLLKNDLDT